MSNTATIGVDVKQRGQIVIENIYQLVGDDGRFYLFHIECESSRMDVDFAGPGEVVLSANDRTQDADNSTDRATLVDFGIPLDRRWMQFGENRGTATWITFVAPDAVDYETVWES